MGLLGEGGCCPQSNSGGVFVVVAHLQEGRLLEEAEGLHLLL